MKKIEISADQVEKMAAIGCNNVEIAHVLGVSEATIRGRFAKTLTKARAGRKAKLRDMLWQSAEAGNIAMQIWLSKVELGFCEKANLHVVTESSERSRAIEKQIFDAEATNARLLSVLEERLKAPPA